MPKIKFTIITLFQEALEPYLNVSMMWKAKKEGIAEFEFVNLRDFGLGPHKSVDDTPYGGGDGMLLRCEPVFEAIESVKKKDKSAEEALKQIEDKGYARPYSADGRTVIRIGVNFNSESRALDGWLVDKD